MTWIATAEDLEAFETHKQRSMVYTPERRALKARLMNLGKSLGGSWQTTDEAPSLANGRRVQEMWLYSIRDPKTLGELAATTKGVDLSSPFALDTLPFHDHLARFVRVDQDGYCWGLLLHAKARADRANLEVMLKKGELKALLEGLEAQVSLDAEAPLAQGDDTISSSLGRGLCVWWRPDEESCGLARIQQDMERLEPLRTALEWQPDRDLANLTAQAVKASKSKKPSQAFAVGDRVRIRKGMLTGRRGQVDRILADGRVVVALGPASMDFNAEDLFREA